jgi:hypothetical protein
VLPPDLLPAAYFSLAVYPGFFSDKIKEKFGVKFYEYHENVWTSTRIAMFTTTTTIYLAVMGTKEIKDFVTNAKFKSRRYNGINSHDGFADCAESVASFAQHAGQIADAAGKKLVLCGHSLGGAVASLLAHMLHVEQLKVQLYTFGQPKTAVGLASLGDKYIRVVNSGDLIPGLPVPNCEHSGQQIFLTHKGEGLINPSKSRVFVDAALPQLWERAGSLKSTHSIASYIEKLENLKF